MEVASQLADADPPVHVSDGDVVAVRWREIRDGRSRRAIHRVRLDLTRERLGGLLLEISGRAHAGEVLMTFADGRTVLASVAAASDWLEGRRADLPEKPHPIWSADERRVGEWGAAVDGARRAIGRLASCGLVAPEVAAGLAERLQVVLGSLPSAPLGLWRP